MTKSHKQWIVGGSLLVLAILAGTVAWSRQQTRLQQEATQARITEASRLLRETITAPTAGDLTALSQAASDAAARADAALSAQRSADTGRILLLGTAADTYLHATRELLRREATLLQLRIKVGADIAAFQQHMLAGNRAAPEWTSGAVRLKNAVEQDYREFQRTLDAHGKLADAWPEARQALAALVTPELPVSNTQVVAAREAAVAAGRELARAVEATRQLAAPR